MITVVTRCMCRKDHLTQSIPTWLTIKEIKEFIIVDYGCKENLDDIKILDSRITIIPVPDKQYFDRGQAWNIGIEQVKTKWILTLDCDIIVNSNFIKDISLLDGPFYYHVIEAGPSLYGISIFKKFDWNYVGKFIEGFKTWGSEDYYFYDNLNLKMIEERKLDSKYFSHIQHNNNRRFENHIIKEKDIINFPESKNNILESILSKATNYNDQWLLSRKK